MNFEDVIKIVVPIAMLLAPLFKILFSISTRLQSIEKQIELDKVRIEEILDRHDRHIHDIRNNLTAVTILMARKGIDNGRQGSEG